MRLTSKCRPPTLSSATPPNWSSTSSTDKRPVRLAVYNDYRFWRVEGRVWTERAFIAFLGGVSERVERLVMPGRLGPEEGHVELAHYPVPEEIEFVPMPWYESLAN